MAIAWEIDPVSEDVANVSLSLTTDPLRLRAEGGMDLTPPDIDPIYAASADTEGDPYVSSRYRNRTIVLSLLAKATTDALTQTAVYGVQQKVDKLRREGGTLKYTTMAGTEIVFDVAFARLKAEFTPEFYTLNKAVPLTMEFECKPYGRGAPILLADHTETTLPCLIFTETSLAGDVPGLGKLVIDNDDATNHQFWVIWGLQSRYYDASANAALFYEAESRTLLGGSTLAVGPSGASGTGSNVVHSLNQLTTTYQPIMSTQASGGGAWMSHVGRFRVFARVQTPTNNQGSVSIALEWGEGDALTVTQNAPAIMPIDDWDGSWRLLDLGQIALSKAVQGTQQWQGRILAKSTVTFDDIDIDYLLFIPVDEGSGEIAGRTQGITFRSITAHDEFDQTVGALTGKTLAVGGTWAGAGDADDANVDATNHIATRTAVSDADINTGRYLIAGTTTFTDVLVQVDAARSVVTGAHSGVLARYIDTSNWLMATVSTSGTIWQFFVRKRVAGTITTLRSTSIPSYGTGWYTVALFSDTAGNWYAYVVPRGGALSTPTLEGNDTALATGGALASGKSGFYDAQTAATASTRSYDNFVTGLGPSPDAAIYASQSLEVRHDRALREDVGGTLWQPPASYEGDRLLVPPAGKEGRSIRMIVKASRRNPTDGPDSGIDDISARMTYTPRHLVLPS